MQLLLYTPDSSARATYIFSTLLNALGIRNYEVTADKLVFKNQLQAKINYSVERITANEVWIPPVQLLFEDKIQPQTITCFDYNGSKAFFKTSGGDFPFDIFAASFYLISRYEEYLPYKNDMYGRYAHENSLAFKENFLRLPLVNLWLHQFGMFLKQKFPSIILHSTPFTFLPTYDIDIAFSYLHKGMVRNLGGFIMAMWNSEWFQVKERMDVLFKKQKDPFDSFHWLHQLHKEHSLKPLYFFLLAAQNKDYDKNILPGKPAIKSMVKQHSLQYDIGIHPSWQSGDKPELLKQEIKKLEDLSGKAVIKSRQHYIRMHLPSTYERLIASGITEDYSMGYGSINGFRASYCLPHLWYNLTKEEITSLTIYPFCYMDANSHYEQHYRCEEALKEMNYYYEITKQVNGLFISIWHNHFLGTDKMFSGWKEIYRTMIERIRKNKNCEP